MRRLRNPIREYAWGSHMALAELTGRPAPTASPEAELWMGAHPSAPSQVETEAGPVSLIEWIRRAPEAVLGRATAQRFGGELPFLFKVLAPRRALSIQVHPDAERARRGFERENAAGLAVDDPRRNYRDSNPKPELICALGCFTALCGFRGHIEVVEGLERLGVPRLAAAAGELRAGGEAGIARLVGALLARDAEERRSLADEVADVVRGRESESPELAEIAELSRQYPGDLGIVFPLLLNLVELAPGEALFLGTGEIHAYLRGVGVELMANSNNVLRGGLTEKHVDVLELLDTLTFREGPPKVIEPGEDASYSTPTPYFRLERLDTASGRVTGDADRGVEILLCTSGSVHVVREADAQEIDLERGASALAPSAAGAYRIEGAGVVHRAGVPH
ncbi:MAG: mannose-6-phosphate isomerase, class I [bacterium]|nr:mannose-6-phosphate isomerase, class I [Deltaproteobacteria bacterium]MCP4243323.1 mannose-6-phosphate isomerase, class I [bacterium]